MSHFGVLVIVESELNNRNQIEEKVKKLLAPYDENTEVPEYEEKCHCVNMKATTFGHQRADEFVSYQELRESFRAARGARNTELFGGAEAEADFYERYASDSEDEEMTKRLMEINRQVDSEFDWGKHIEKRIEMENEAIKSHPLFEKPNPECERCGGGGIAKSTYNPDSKWDWWQIGGRYSGAFADGYNPADDPRNRESCMICGGTGHRTDHHAQGGFMQQIIEEQMNANESLREELASVLSSGFLGIPVFDQESNAKLVRKICDGKFPDGVSEILKKGLATCHVGMKCNGCNGSGVSVKWPTDWTDYGNIVSLSAIPEDFLSYAVVTPDGKWHEKGKMGWFGISSDDMSDEKWQESFSVAIAGYQKVGGYIAVIVDCHI